MIYLCLYQSHASPSSDFDLLAVLIYTVFSGHTGAVGFFTGNGALLLVVCYARMSSAFVL